ncbi:hypothetical protein STEG23_022864 [Scotinomys teguina]
MASPKLSTCETGALTSWVDRFGDCIFGQLWLSFPKKSSEGIGVILGMYGIGVILGMYGIGVILGMDGIRVVLGMDGIRVVLGMDGLELLTACHCFFISFLTKVVPGPEESD